MTERTDGPAAPAGHGPLGHVPPPLRPEDVGRERLRTWVARGCIVWFVLAVVASLVAIVIPQFPKGPGKKHFHCQNNLSQLAGLYVESSADAGWRPRSGQALLLEWRKTGRIKPGQESVLICPGDQSVALPDTPEARARYDTVDLDDPPADLCSYAVRDFDRFPPNPARLGDEPFAACVGRFHDGTWSACHKGGMNIAWCDGSTQILEWSELGLGEGATPPDDPPIVGPESPSPLLRVLCFRPGVTERAAR